MAICPDARAPEAVPWAGQTRLESCRIDGHVAPLSLDPTVSKPLMFTLRHQPKGKGERRKACMSWKSGCFARQP